MKKYLLTTLSLLSVLSMGAAIPKGYYDGLDGKKQEALKTAAKESALEHTAISYSSGTWEAFKTTDVRVVNGETCWWDMYSDNNVPITTTSGLNVEHSVPNSWWGKIKNDAYKDLFHLNPSDAEANNRKSFYPLGIVETVTYTNGVTTVGKPATGASGGSPNVFEPADEYKGDFARAYMYIFTIYDDIPWKYDSDDRNFMFDGSTYPTLTPWAYQLLLQWAKEDPVSTKEIDRNDAVYAVQGNRNPFIDFPELCEYIWGDKQNEVFDLATAKTSTDMGDEDPGENPGEDPDTEECIYFGLDPQSAELTDWSLDVDMTIDPSITYVWKWRVADSGNYLNGSSYVGGAHAAESYAVSPNIDLTDYSAVTVSFDHAASYQTLLRTECKFYARNVGDTEWQEVPITAWPDTYTWNTTNTGDMSLSQFEGKPVELAFFYKGTAENSDTWRISNFKVKGKKVTTTVQKVDNQVSPVAYGVRGQLNIITEGTGIRNVQVYDMAGRLVATGNGENLSVNLPSGVYFVNYGGQTKTSKVLVK